MNIKQRGHAAVMALELISAGSDPLSLVHIQYYPWDYWNEENEIQGLSTPLAPNSDLSGLINVYFTLEELILDGGPK